jgi:hypothetical protein
VGDQSNSKIFELETLEEQNFFHQGDLAGTPALPGLINSFD